MSQFSATPPKPADHAALMDNMYRYQRHIYDLTRKYYLFGRDETIRGIDLPSNGTLLDVGCGTGRNLVLAKRAFPDARFYGLDISDEMLISARKACGRDGFSPLLKTADATAFSAADFGVTGFDRILISYALSMIPDWQNAVSTAIGALSSKGQLHIVDFGQGERLPQSFSHLLRTWLGKFHVTPRSALREVIEDLARKNSAHCRFQSIGGGYAWRLIYTAAG